MSYNRSPIIRAISSAIALSLAMATIASEAGGASAAGRAARSFSASDTAHLRYLPSKSEGATLYEEGAAAGDLPGHMVAHLTVEATFSGSFVLYTRGGSIKGHGTATPSGSGRYESFRGSLQVTGGSGRYAGARGKAGLYGVFDRRTYQLTIQTTGRLAY